jgi:hypothetical protein
LHLLTSTHQVSLPFLYKCCSLRIDCHHSPRPNSSPCLSETSSIPTKLVWEQGRLSFIRSNCIVDVQAHCLLPPPLPRIRTMLSFPLLARFKYWTICNVDGYCSPTFLYVMLHCGHVTFLQDVRHLWVYPSVPSHLPWPMNLCHAISGLNMEPPSCASTAFMRFHVSLPQSSTACTTAL